MFPHGMPNLVCKSFLICMTGWLQERKARDWARAEIARHASRWIHAAEVQNFTFFNPLVFLSRILEHRIGLRPGSSSACG